MTFRLSASLRLCGILLVASQAAADEPLVWKWAEGDTARYQMTQKMGTTMDAGPAGEVKVDSEMNMVMLWSIDAVDDAGARLRQSTERVVMKNNGPGGQGFEYDSQDEDPPMGMAALIAPMFEAMVENDFLMTMRPSGEVVDVQLTDEMAEAFERLPGGAVSADMVKQMTLQGSLRFPDEPLALGDTWTTEIDVKAPQVGVIKTVMTYTYDGPRKVDDREYEAFTPSINASLPGNGQVSVETVDSTGEILFDREAGRLFRSRVLQTMAVTITMGDQQIVNNINQAVELRALEEGEELLLSAAADAEASMAE